MAIPGRTSTEGQTHQGHAPLPTYDAPMYRVGRKGLDLVNSLADIDPEALSRMLNVRSVYGGPLEVRPGQNSIATTAGVERVHSLFRLNDPGAGTFTRFAGSAANLFRGQSGALTNVDTGYSGDPLTFTGVTMPLSGTPYVVVSDRSRQRKISRTAAVETFGIPPGVLTSTTLTARPLKLIAQFAAADGTQAAAWTALAGTDRTVPPNASAAPTLTDIVVPWIGVSAVTNVGASATGYWSAMSIAKALNLNFLDVPNTIPASDEDHFNLIIYISDPQRLEELKIYFVLDAVFIPGVLPGLAGGNTQAWVKSFRPNDMQDYYETLQSGLDAGDDLRLRTLLEQFKTQQTGDDRATLIDVTGSLDLNRTDIPQVPAGRTVIYQPGQIGIPLRRGTWQRLGTDTSRTWANVSGIFIQFQTNVVAQIDFRFQFWNLTGGSGPDSADVGFSPYDVRVTNYHPVNGSEGNPSAVQAEANWLNPLRQGITVQPAASGIAALRQRIYVRGGGAASTQNWFFSGVNTADGAAFNVIDTDDQRVAAAELEIDNDQPVTSINPTTGATILNQTLPIYFLVEDFVFGLGDPNLPGRLYRSKQSKPEQWPATEYIDVCSSTEELMNGGQIGSQGFCFSRSRLYSILLSADGTFTTEPTQCNEGLISRWAMAVTPFGIAFVSPFGVRLTSGGVPERLSDTMLEPLFTGQAQAITTVRGMSVIDFTVPTALQLAYYDDELWLTYQAVDGTRRQLIYNFFDKAWRPYTFTSTIASVYGEPVQGATPSLLLGGNATGAVYQHTGYSDGVTNIPFSFRTGALDFGDKYREKTFTEVLIDAEIFNNPLTAQARLNDEDITVASQAVTGIAGLRRYSFEPFGDDPQRGRNVNVDFSGTAPAGSRPFFNIWAVSSKLQPAIQFNQATPWEELPGGEGYLWGALITCDTGNTARAIVVEYTTNNGSVTTAATITVQANGRRKLPFSWLPVLAQQVRIRPTGTCEPWITWKIEWLSDPEPPRLTLWDTNWENFGTMADKWLKGYLLEADTLNQAVTVVVDLVDASSVQQLAQDSRAFTFNGRGVQQVSFAKLRGRLFRLRSTTALFWKLYKWQPIFDEEPLALTRWQTQERPHEGLQGKWQKPLEAFISIRSSGTVTLQITSFGASGTTMNTSSYNLASTAGAKQKIRVPLNAAKGLLFEYLFTASAGFWLYREESEILVEDWMSGKAEWLPLPASNDDLDPARRMGNAQVAAATPGGA